MLKVKFKIKVFATILCIVISSCVTLFANFAFAQTNNQVAKIYATNDVHGYDNKCLQNSGACYATAKQLKADGGKNTYLIDAGDHTSGSAYANFDRGMSMLKFMKMSGYDFVVPGNHEFDYGINHFFEMVDYAKTPEADTTPFNYYACNFWHMDHGTKTSSVFEPYKTLTTEEGIKIALVGIMTPESISKSSEGYFQDSEGNFLYSIDAAGKDSADEPLYKTVQENIDKARSEADIVIGVGHLGVSEASAYNRSTELISHTKGLDAFADGHSHTYLCDEVEDLDHKKIPRIQTETEYKYIGSFDISGNKEDGFKVDAQVFQDSPLRDSVLLNAEKNWVNSIDDAYNVEVGSTNQYLYDNSDPVGHGTSTRLIRLRETNLANVVTDSFYWIGNINHEKIGKKLECDGAILNGGALRTQVEPGVIYYKECDAVMPFINQYAITELPGQVLLDALEFGAREYGTGIENAGILQVSGITYQVDINKPSKVVLDEYGGWVSGPGLGEYRINSVKVYNKITCQYEGLDLNKKYKIAGIDYMFSNYGDGYLMFRNKDVKTINYALSPTNVMALYINSFTGDVSSSHSPLYTMYKNYLLNYDNIYGSNRFGAFCVSFNPEDGSYVSPQYVYPEGLAYLPKPPKRDGYEFDGWYLGDTKFDFNTAINSNTVLTAKWKSVSTPQEDSNLTNTSATGDDSIWYILILIVTLSSSIFVLSDSELKCLSYFSK